MLDLPNPSLIADLCAALQEAVETSERMRVENNWERLPEAQAVIDKMNSTLAIALEYGEMVMEQRVKLGDRARDVLTGMEGIVFGITSYATGCDHIGLKRQGTTPDGNQFDMHWCDEPLVEVLETGALQLPGDASPAKKNGGPPLHSFGRR